MCITGPIIQLIDLIYGYWGVIPPDGIKPKTKEEVESYLNDFVSWVDNKSVKKLLVHGLMTRFGIKGDIK